MKRGVLRRRRGARKVTTRLEVFRKRTDKQKTDGGGGSRKGGCRRGDQDGGGGRRRTANCERRGIKGRLSDREMGRRSRHKIERSAGVRDSRGEGPEKRIGGGGPRRGLGTFDSRQDRNGNRMW